MSTLYFQICKPLLGLAISISTQFSISHVRLGAPRPDVKRNLHFLLQHHNPDLILSQDAKITHVVPGGPAALAGLEKDQYVIAINGSPMTALEIQKWALSHCHLQQKSLQSPHDSPAEGTSGRTSGAMTSDYARNLNVPSSLSHSPFQSETTPENTLATAEIGYLQGSQFIRNEDDSEGSMRVGYSRGIQITVECRDGSERTVMCHPGDGDVTTDYASECFQLLDQILQQGRRQGDVITSKTAEKAVQCLESLLREQKQREMRQQDRVAHLQNKAQTLLGKCEATLYGLEPSDVAVSVSSDEGEQQPSQSARRQERRSLTVAANMPQGGGKGRVLNRSPDTNPPDSASALRAQEAKEALEEILYYQALSWEDEKTVAGLVALTPQASVGDDEGTGVTIGNIGEVVTHLDKSVEVVETPSREIEESSSDEVIETPRREIEGERKAEDEAVFEMVLDIRAEEILGREEELKKELAREVCMSLSLRSLEQQAEAMARHILATPSATPASKTLALKQSAPAEPATADLGELDHGEMLCQSGALQVRDLILEPASVIVEMTWTPAKAEALSASAAAQHKDAETRNASAEARSGDKESLRGEKEGQTANVSLADTQMSNMDGRGGKPKLPSGKQLVADLESQVFTPESKLKQGIFSRHITGLSQPVVSSPSTSGVPRLARNKGPSVSDLEPGSGTLMCPAEAIQPSVEPSIDYEAPYLVQRCTLTTVKSLEAHVDALQIAIQTTQQRLTRHIAVKKHETEVQAHRSRELAVSAGSISSELASLQLDLERVAKEHSEAVSRYNDLHIQHLDYSARMERLQVEQAHKHEALRQRVCGLLKLVSTGDATHLAQREFVAAQRPGLSPAAQDQEKWALLHPAPTSQDVDEQFRNLNPSPIAEDVASPPVVWGGSFQRAAAEDLRGNSPTQQADCESYEHEDGVMGSIKLLEATLQSLVDAQLEAADLRSKAGKVDELEERIRGLIVFEEEASCLRSRVLEMEDKSQQDLRRLQNQMDEEVTRLNAVVVHNEREIQQAGELERLKEYEREKEREREEEARCKLEARWAHERSALEQDRDLISRELEETQTALDDFQKQVKQKNVLVQSLNDVVLSEKAKVKQLSAALETELEGMDQHSMQFEKNLDMVAAGMRNFEEILELLQDATRARITEMVRQASDCEHHLEQRNLLQEEITTLEAHVANLTAVNDELRAGESKLVVEVAALRAKSAELEGAMRTLNSESLEFFTAEEKNWQMENEGLREEIDQLRKSHELVLAEHDRALHAEFVRGGAERLVMQLIAENKVEEVVEALLQQVGVVESAIRRAHERSAERDEEEEATKRSLERLKENLTQTVEICGEQIREFTAEKEREREEAKHDSTTLLRLKEQQEEDVNMMEAQMSAFDGDVRVLEEALDRLASGTRQALLHNDAEMGRYKCQLAQVEEKSEEEQVAREKEAEQMRMSMASMQRAKSDEVAEMKKRMIEMELIMSQVRRMLVHFEIYMNSALYEFSVHLNCVSN